jgi:hypothetical protein
MADLERLTSSRAMLSGAYTNRVDAGRDLHESCGQPTAIHAFSTYAGAGIPAKNLPLCHCGDTHAPQICGNLVKIDNATIDKLLIPAVHSLQR